MLTSIYLLVASGLIITSCLSLIVAVRPASTADAASRRRC